MLHVGNIAGNAYLNAKLLRRAGIECHVLSYDYYDLMATPEWEENENGRGRRPYWFVQGPFRPCAAYLYALLDERAVARHLLAARLRIARALVIRPPIRRAGSRVKGAGRHARQRLSVLLSTAWRPLYFAYLGIRRRLLVLLRIAARLPAAASADLNGAGGEAARMRQLVERFRDLFPDRRDPLTEADIARWGDSEPWRRLFERYDVVQCYATDPIRALLAGTRPYVAYEHGTLRDFTLGDDPVHRLNALAYRESDHAFVTNGDCLEYARRIGIPRFSPLPHPVDVDQHEADYGEEPARIRRRLDADVLLLCPLRHDWGIKRTDVHLRALPGIVELGRGRVRLVLCRWGAEVEASEQLIEQLGCADAVVWRPPLSRPQLIKHMQAADVVLDQMALPHFGATAPQALAAGVPVVMSYRPESTAWMVDEPPPILPAFDPEGVVRAVETALDPDWRADFRRRAREWTHRHNHPDRIIVEHCRVYRSITEAPLERRAS